MFPSILAGLAGIVAATARPPNAAMTMVGIANGGNPGESPQATSFTDPDKLKDWVSDAPCRYSSWTPGGTTG